MCGYLLGEIIELIIPSFGHTGTYISNKSNNGITLMVLHFSCVACSVTRKIYNVFKNCPKMISLEKWTILTPLQKLLKNVGDLGKLIVAKGFKNCPKCKKLPHLVTLVACIASIIHLALFSSIITNDSY